MALLSDVTSPFDRPTEDTTQVKRWETSLSLFPACTKPISKKFDVGSSYDQFIRFVAPLLATELTPLRRENLNKPNH